MARIQAFFTAITLPFWTHKSPLDQSYTQTCRSYAQQTAEGSKTRSICLAGGTLAGGFVVGGALTGGALTGGAFPGGMNTAGAEDPFEHLSTAVLSSFRVRALNTGGTYTPGGEPESECDTRGRATVFFFGTLAERTLQRWSLKVNSTHEDEGNSKGEGAGYAEMRM